MTRTNMDGVGIKRVLEWMLDRDLTELDLASALGISESTYNRNKTGAGFPSFEELDTLGNAFGVSPVVLHIAFGLTDTRMLPFLEPDEMRQYLRQGGGNHLDPILALIQKEGYQTVGAGLSVTPTMMATRLNGRGPRDEIDEYARKPWDGKPAL
jgi:transcriptional regulator with XRE-family HTH domain